MQPALSKPQRRKINTDKTAHLARAGVQNGCGEPDMRAKTSFIAALCAFALNPIGAQIAFRAEPASNCGIPSDIHDGWAMTSPEKQGLNATLLCTMDDGITGG